MEILSEKTIKVIEMQVEFEDHEHYALYEHAKKNMPKKILDDLMISWALGDILREKLKELDKKPAAKNKQKKASKGAKVYHDLDHLAGTWDEKDVKEFNENTKISKRTKK